MLIENPESLQTWLTSYLEPLYDADPQALAKYVMALIGKDEPTKNLKHILSEQLESFLQKETASFVEVLFETIDNKSYLDSVNFDNNDDASPDRSPSELDYEEDASQSPVDHYYEHCNLDSPHQFSPAEYEPKSLPDSGGSNAPGGQIASSSHIKRSYQNRERSKSRSNSRSRSPIPHYHHRPQDVDMRRTTGYIPSNQPESGDSRGYFTDEQRNHQTSQSPRGINRRFATSSSSLLPHLGRGYRHNGEEPLSKRSRVSSKSLNEEDGVEKERQPPIAKICDSDDRIFSMRRDLCQFNHGSDPVVLDSAVSSVVFGVPANGPSALAATQNISTSGSTSFLNEPYNPEAPGIDSKPINPHCNRRGSGLSALSVRGAAPMGNNYNHISQHPFWRPIAPPLRPLPPGSTSSSFIPSMSQSNRPRELVGVPTLSENSKNSSLTSSINNPDLSKLMHKSEMDASTPSTQSSTNLNSGSNSHHHNNNSPNHLSKRGGSSARGSGHRGGFRGGYIKRMINNESADKCTLEVRKIPPNLNTIANLNSHFSKFGSIVNLQVCYDGDPRAALITFSNHKESLAANRSSEAVFNNRFIKVFWHSTKNSAQSAINQQHSSPPTTTCESEIHLQSQHAHEYVDPQYYLSNEYTDGGFPSLSSNVKERLGFHHGFDYNLAVSTNFSDSGSISRTVYNSNLMKGQYSTATTSTRTIENNNLLNSNMTQEVKPELNGEGFGVAPFNTTPSVVVRSTEDIQRDKLLSKLALQKKRQHILVDCMQGQKLLIDKLEKAKTSKEKSDIRLTVEIFDKQITKLKSEIKKEAEIILAGIAELPSSIRKAKIQVEKELLDMEMEFYSELHKGSTPHELRQKLHELKIKAKALCMNDLRSTKIMVKRIGKMKLALRDRNRFANHTLAKNFENLRKVDRRTRKIFIEGVTANDNNLLLSHLSQSAEIESLETTPLGVMVTFKTRRDAEKALPLISSVKLKGETPLKASWFDEAVLCSSLLCYISFLCPN